MKPRERSVYFSKSIFRLRPLTSAPDHYSTRTVMHGAGCVIRPNRALNPTVDMGISGTGARGIGGRTFRLTGVRPAFLGRVDGLRPAPCTSGAPSLDTVDRIRVRWTGRRLCSGRARPPQAIPSVDYSASAA